MKAASLLFLFSFSLAGQVPGKVIVFNRSDTEHCRVVMIEGRPMLQTAFDGTSVAVGLPVSTAGGDFRVFVQVRRTGRGKVQVKPREFSALYGDAAHTRFSYYDKAAEVTWQTPREQTPASGVVAASSQRDPAAPGAASPTAGIDDKDRQARWRRVENERANGAGRDEEQAREQQQGARPGTTLSPDELYLRPGSLRQGGVSEGFVYFRRPKGSALHVGPRDLLFEVDISVNGVVFRFS